jgi:uncharacterized membrane protein (UPF0136 family)
MQFQNIVFWTYVILLIAGGLIGFFKAHSKVSLNTSAVSAALLVLTHIGIFAPSFGRQLADIIMVMLIVVFAMRLAKSKKFIPSGLMLVLTVVVLAMLNFRRTW